MGFDEFKAKPSDSKANHPVYQSSLFSPAAAEYTTGEVILGSVYRRLLLDIREPQVDLSAIQSLPFRLKGSIGDETLWVPLLRQGGLGSPPTRRSKYPQLMPLVPQIARYACVLGGQRNRWNPSNLLLEAVGAGLGKERGESLIKQLGAALDIDETDDILARFVENRFRDLQSDSPAIAPYQQLELTDEQTSGFRGGGRDGLNPAERFCRDLRVILDQKLRLTRRQWTVLIEAELRLGLAMHLLWICQANDQLWKLALAVCDGNTPPTVPEIEHALWNVHREIAPLLQVGSPAMPLVEQLIRAYLTARIGLNLLLYELDERNVGWTQKLAYLPETNAAPAFQIAQFLEHLYVHRDDLEKPAAPVLAKGCADLVDITPDLLRLEEGFTKNMREFVRHTLGQLDARSSEQSSYDQAYLMRSRSSSRKGSIVVMPGPAMLIAMVNSCYHASPTKLASLEDLRSHLADYGLHVPAGELIGGQVGYDLQKLGLVVDSPDAAGGRLLVPPFDV